MYAYLRTDGMLVLKLVRLNMGVNTTTEIVENLFKHFKTLDSSLKYSDSMETIASFRTMATTSAGAPSMGAPSIGMPSRPNSPAAFNGGGGVSGGAGGRDGGRDGGGGGGGSSVGGSVGGSIDRRFLHHNNFDLRHHPGHGKIDTVV